MNKLFFGATAGLVVHASGSSFINEPAKTMILIFLLVIVHDLTKGGAA